MSTPVFIGEVNPYGTDPRYALYPLPEKSAGGRLCRMLELPMSTYLRCVRRNLCTGTWNHGEAHKSAQEILVNCPGSTVVLLGAKVAAAFRLPYHPFGDLWVQKVEHGIRIRHYEIAAATVPEFDFLPVRCLILPHPSGRCRAWHVPGSRERAQVLVRSHYPDWEGWRGPHGSAEICRLSIEEEDVERGGLATSNFCTKPEEDGTLRSAPL